MLLVALGPAGAAAWEQPSGKWETLTGCRLDPGSRLDGDSFYVRHGERTFLFRLYSVDAPEVNADYPDRVADQARHFGVTDRQVLRIGEDAARFTRRMLTGATFTVDTCWQDARGNSRDQRFYGVVTVDGKDLATELAAAGLARVYGFTPAGRPGFSLAALQLRERRARTARLGGYGLGPAAAARPSPGASRLPPTISEFATPTPPPAPGEADVPGRINVNTATAAELETLPGIGPTRAAAIIAGRPYRDVADLLRVPGIGDKTLAMIESRVVAAP